MLSNLLSPRCFLHNDAVFRVGDMGHCMYILERGTVKITRGTCPKSSVDSIDGDVLAVLKEGSYFGEISLLHTARLKMSAFADGTVVSLIIIPRYIVDNVLNKN